MNKRYFAFFVILALLSVSVFALGDDVDFGGSSDWGGSDWGSSDWGSDWGDSDWSGSSGGSFYFYGGSSIVPILIVIGVMVLRIYNASRTKGSSSGGYKPRPASAARPSAAAPGGTKKMDFASINQLLSKDPNFSVADIEAKVKNWALMFETAWCSGKMDTCRPFISDGLYNSYVSQLSMMAQNGEASRTEDMAVTTCNVESWRKDGDKEYLDVWLAVKKRTYKVSIADPNKVLKGNRNITYNLEYRWQLMRSAGSISDNAGIRVEECPNCGAQTSINQSGKCAFCGSTLSAESFDWVLNKVDKLAQREHR